VDHLVDVIVRFGATLDDAGRLRIEQALRGMGGVAAVDFPGYRARLAYVLYHPGRVRLQHILDQARKASKMHAELVGPMMPREATKPRAERLDDGYG
jgi:hypothetical protein